MAMLQDKVAVITGAGRGIGRATALAFAAQGARVVVNDWGCDADGQPGDEQPAADVADEIVRAGGVAVADTRSVADPQQARELIELAEQRFGQLDVLVNNAGIGTNAPLHRLDGERWQRVLQVQLTGSFYCLRAAASLMKKHGGGSIINTTSLAGVRGNWGQAHVSAAASGVVGLTRTASVELQQHDIRVNAVSPVAKTRLTEHLPMFEHVDSMRSEHVAPVHVFLASDASREVTGSLVSVAGGKISVFRLVESIGALKEEDDGIWRPEEIAEHWRTISRQ